MWSSYAWLVYVVRYTWSRDLLDAALNNSMEYVVLSKQECKCRGNGEDILDADSNLGWVHSVCCTCDSQTPWHHLLFPAQCPRPTLLPTPSHHRTWRRTPEALPSWYPMNIISRHLTSLQANQGNASLQGGLTSTAVHSFFMSGWHVTLSIKSVRLVV